VAVTLIDLDEPVRHQPGEAPVLRMVRKVAARRRRAAVAAAGAVVLMLCLGASVSASESATPRLHPVGPSASHSRYAVDGDQLFTVGSDSSSVSAYSMVSGEAVWRLEVNNVNYLRALAGVAVVGVMAVIGTTSTGEMEVLNEDEVFAVDAKTGRRVWSHPGRVPEGIEGTDLVVVDGRDGLRGYDPRTGAAVWQRGPGDQFIAPVVDGSQRVLMQDVNRALSSVDIRTGASTPQGQLDQDAVALFGFGDPLTVITAVYGQEASSSHVLGVQPALPHSLTWPHQLSPDLMRLNGGSCGGYLCTTLGSTTTATDPANGNQVWQAGAEWVNHRTVRVGGSDLLITVKRGRTGPRTFLLDPGTGRVRMDLANWNPIGAYAGRQLVQWIPASTYDASWLGWLDPTAPGGVRPLFALGQVFRCTVTQAWLFCEVVGGNGQAGALRLDAIDSGGSV
jgi:outer membrane protein assembly factor BamB